VPPYRKAGANFPVLRRSSDEFQMPRAVASLHVATHNKQPLARRGFVCCLSEQPPPRLSQNATQEPP